ncbi:NAD(P)-binding protein [Petrotoga sp. 9PWA.NaAc.5.4]|uniref:NAD(P)-binding protein n=1 Tax=Petrotoga sp. 9PWA.NaAc.5.4 TaxID=1434328 RepID=UPI000CB95F15|nr:NAD(P)-binding protein [Petrotoga sp. 9PWA.NaAc.5.4]PNR94141.1 potassium transporter TrkA [Petrotoga sp. 9PWA.NaAc.5.4]
MRDRKTKFIIIIGCGRLGSELAIKLSKNHNVVVIDKDETSFERLTKRNFIGFTRVVDTNDMAALKDLNIDKADMIYIVTPDDNLNFMLAYGIREINEEIKLAARVNDPLKKAIFIKANVNLFCPIEDSVNQLVEELDKVDEKI